jgi:hypothetical protein
MQRCFLYFRSIQLNSKYYKNKMAEYYPVVWVTRWTQQTQAKISFTVLPLVTYKLGSDSPRHSPNVGPSSKLCCSPEGMGGGGAQKQKGNLCLADKISKIVSIKLFQFSYYCRRIEDYISGWKKPNSVSKYVVQKRLNSLVLWSNQITRQHFTFPERKI